MSPDASRPPPPARRNPNIVVTGTPGTGKTTHCAALVERVAGLRHVSVNDVVREQGCHDGWDAAFQSWLVDEDRLLDALEPALAGAAGGCVVDWHACDLFPERWVDLVVVLRADTASLYDRLAARNYPEAKLQENMDAEIMEVLLQEARDAFAEEMVVELASNTPDDMEANVDRIAAWIAQWKKDQGVEGEGEGEEEEAAEAAAEAA